MDQKAIAFHFELDKAVPEALPISGQMVLKMPYYKAPSLKFISRK